MRPLRWDDAGPWEFWLTVTPDDTGKTYAISGELRRAGERLALETPLLLLSGGLVFWEDRVAPLLDFGAFQWIALLRQQGKVPVPAKQKQEFLAELLRLPDLPRLDLPEDLRYEEVAPAPRPYLTDQAPRRPALDVRPGSELAHRRPLLRVRRPRRARAEPGPERLRARQATAAAARPGGRAVLRGQARGGRLPPQDRLPPGRDHWSCSHATCRKPRGPSSRRAGASRPRGSCTARRATSGSR